MLVLCCLVGIHRRHSCSASATCEVNKLVIWLPVGSWAVFHSLIVKTPQSVTLFMASFFCYMQHTGVELRVASLNHVIYEVVSLFFLLIRGVIIVVFWTYTVFSHISLQFSVSFKIIKRFHVLQRGPRLHFPLICTMWVEAFSHFLCQH